MNPASWKPIDIIAIAGSIAIFGMVAWLTSRGSLKPRYSLLWLAAAAALVTVSVWRRGIDVLGDAAGIVYKPALVFLGACVFLMLILLHMSVVVSRLTDRTRRLAQELALLRGELERRSDRG
ncbi:MAG: DUF2304 domain-containing protein [Planctomycetes bacterium]|nr:DUF2304 domain-containing protein [Planctomycetota bacterium]